MDEWQPVFFLTNIHSDVLIENEYLAIVSHDEPRLEALRKAHPPLARFLDRFRDPDGRKCRPSVLIARASAPAAAIKADALASFRDLIVASVIPRSWAIEELRPFGFRLIWSDYFKFYPYTITTDYREAIALTPGREEVCSLGMLSGQSSPEVWSGLVTEKTIDIPLLKILLRRWQRRYLGRVTWADRALFRSLNMANAASQAPAAVDLMFYDTGRVLALWVSAFEILAHPRTRKSGLLEVYRLLDAVNWETPACSALQYRAYEGGRQTGTLRSLACWLYGEIYKLRNAFLHGNPVTPTQFHLKRSGRHILKYAAPLYRLALTGFLPVESPKSHPPRKPGGSYGFNEDFLYYQWTIEEALGTAMKPIRKLKRDQN